MRLVAFLLISRDHFATKTKSSPGPSEPLNTTAGIQVRSECGASVAATPGSRALGVAMLTFQIKRFYCLRQLILSYGDKYPEIQ